MGRKKQLPPAPPAPDTSVQDSSAPDTSLPGELAATEIGYGKPPPQHQFAKGCSGNPKGRPKGSRNFRKLIAQDLQRPVTVTYNGKRRRISKLEALAMALVNKSMQMDGKAIGALLPIMDWMAEQEDAQSARKRGATTSDDLAILQRYFISGEGES